MKEKLAFKFGLKKNFLHGNRNYRAGAQGRIRYM